MSRFTALSSVQLGMMRAQPAVMPKIAERNPLATRGPSQPSGAQWESAPTVRYEAADTIKLGPQALQALLQELHQNDRQAPQATILRAPPETLRSQAGTLIGRFLHDNPIGPERNSDATKQLAGLKHLPLFTGISVEQLAAAQEAHELRLIEMDRDRLLYLGEDALLSLSGQVAFGRFVPEHLAEARAAQQAPPIEDELAEKARRQRIGPLSKQAVNNSLCFREGELILLGSSYPALEFSLYTLTPVRAVYLARSALERWASGDIFFYRRLRSAIHASHDRIAGTDAEQSLVTDFFVRHGISLAETLRVREIDKCISCGACEAACAERYGVNRLSLHGPVLGRVDFVKSCHTCSDPRCIEPCEYSAISFDTQTREIVIDEGACTGCMLCAKSCPYDAIEIHQLDEQPRLQLRLLREGMLSAGEPGKRRLPIHRIASKCDHCVSYPDQACISACPTGALLEVAPRLLFQESALDLAVPAVDALLHVEPLGAAKAIAAQPLIEGNLASVDRAKGLRQWFTGAWSWVCGWTLLSSCMIEIFLRRTLPGYSVQFYYLTWIRRLEAPIVLANVSFRLGSPLAIFLGWTGTLLLTVSALAAMMRRLRSVAPLGAQRSYFSLHVCAGTFGGLFILLHSAGKLDNWVSIPIWLMVFTLLSGIVGRKLAPLVELYAEQDQLEALDRERRIARLLKQHPALFPAVQACAERCQRYQLHRGSEHALMLLFLILCESMSSWLLLRRELGQLAQRSVRRQAAELLSRTLKAERHQSLFSALAVPIHAWRWIHISSALLCAALAILHILRSRSL